MRRLSLAECPLWVKSGHLSLLQRCLLYPQERTSVLKYRVQHSCVRAVRISRPHPCTLTTTLIFNLGRTANEEVGAENCSPKFQAIRNPDF